MCGNPIKAKQMLESFKASLHVVNMCLFVGESECQRIGSCGLLIKIKYLINKSLQLKNRY